MLRHVFSNDEWEGYRPRNDSSERTGTVRVRLSTSSGGTRWVTLPRDQVEGRTPRQVAELAISALESCRSMASPEEAAANLLFAQDCRRLMSQRGFGLDAASEHKFLLPNMLITSQVLGEELFLDLGVDHRAGQERS